jgi:WD40 repeat protein
MAENFDSMDKYGLRHLPRHLLRVDRWDDLARVSRALNYLNIKAKCLGIHSLLEDYAVLRAQFPRDHSDWRELNRLYRLVRREAHVFRDWNSQDLPLLFLQRIRNKASDERWDSVQTEAEDLLASGGVWLRSIKYLGLTEKPITQAMGHDDVVQCIAFSPDGERIASGGNDGLVRIWNVSTDVEEQRFEGYADRVTDVAFSHDGRWLLSVGDEHGRGVIHLVDMGTGDIIWTAQTDSGINCVAFSSDGRQISTGDRKGILSLWKASDGKLLGSFAHPNWIEDVAFAPDDQVVASACWDGVVRLWRLETGLESEALGKHRGGCKGVAFSPDGNLVAWTVGQPDCGLSVWDLRASAVLWQKKVRQLTVPEAVEVGCVVFSPDSRLVALGTWDNRVIAFDARTGRKVRNWTGHSGPVLGVSFSPDGELIASASLDGSIRLWRSLWSG